MKPIHSKLTLFGALAGLMLAPNKVFSQAVPPPGPVRASAEFEPSGSVVVSWNYSPTSVFNPVKTFMVKNIQSAGTKVYLLVTDAAMKTNVENHLAGQSPPVTTANIEFVFYEPNDWTWGYSAQSIFFDGTNNTPGLVDVDYDPAGAEMSYAFPEYLSAILPSPLFSADENPNHLVHSNGDFLTDGFGFGLSSETILGLNNNDAVLIANIYETYYGITPNYIVSGVHWSFQHIDLLMKFLDEETLLVGQYVGELEAGINAVIAYITSNFLSAWGTPFKIVRIPTPGPDVFPAIPYPNQYYAYTNSLVVNNYVLVPLFNKPEDAGALAIYKAAMPGYTVIGHDFSSQIAADPLGVFNGGFIHCLSHEITRADTFIPATGVMPVDLNVPDGMYDKFYTLVSKNTMTLDGNVQVKVGGHVRTKSDGQIVMGPGFSVENGAYFRAAIKQ